MGGRYDILLDIVDSEKPKTIMEIGVYKGDRAVSLSDVALKYGLIDQIVKAR